ncbi:divalent-cation tolerance protein CutA [Patescibacteria group bacterium]|nr:divalent-cation tolerance protein CutA [Patescibacteria group bacterium]
MYKLIYITTTNEKEAKRIAEVLVEERLAACVNRFPIKSIYRWAEKIQRESEIALIVKTKDELVDKVIKRVKELHSYEVPCIISISIEKGYSKFLKWVDKETK